MQTLIFEETTLGKNISGLEKYTGHLPKYWHEIIWRPTEGLQNT